MDSSYGVVWQAKVRLGLPWWGEVGTLGFGMVRCRSVWCGKACLGTVRSGWVWFEYLGKVRCVGAGCGLAWRGLSTGVRRGIAR